MAKPKLALIPSAIGDKLYSVLPSDGSGDFDFTRATTATRINKDGLIETVASGDARLNYPMIDGKVSGCPSHLLEPQRTNLLTYSEDFTQSNWFSNGGTRTPNQSISPDGSLNATEFLFNSYASGIYTFGFAAGTYTMSIFIKPISGDGLIRLGLGLDNSQLNTTTLELTNQGTGNGSLIDYGNGWYRFITTVTTSASTSPNIYNLNSNNVRVYIYGAQLEIGSYATSYIPTNGSTATRDAETANNAGDVNTFNDSEGVLMAEISALNDDGGGSGTISISDTSFDNIVKFGYRSEVNKINVVVRSDAQNIFDIQANVENLTNYLKICLKYKQNDFSLYVNGFKIDELLNGSNPLNLSKLQLADANASLNPFIGNTKQIRYYDTILSDSELEELTSWSSFVEMANSQLYSVY